jgi:PncC family amidohydrolase
VISASAIQALEQLCRTRRWTLGLAESCTGGLLSGWICSYPGVSSFYKGCVVSYARSVKSGLLRVPESLLQVHGEVSLTTAAAMAHGAQKVLDCTWSLSVTGIAGPSGGTPEKPVGFVCFAAVGPAFERAVSKQFEGNSPRQDIQRQAALFAFDFLLNAMR